MKLYVITGACSLASNIALREAGLEFGLVKVSPDTKQCDDGTDFLKVTSKGYVPALQLDDGRVLTESVAVLQYIADRNPDAGLAPTAGTFERYRLQEWLSFINTELHKAFGPFYDPGASETDRTRARSRISRWLGWTERQLTPAGCLLGARFSIADAYLFTVLGWAPENGIEMTAWPALAKYHAKIRLRPMVRAALDAEA